jgi:hypothetical protein
MILGKIEIDEHYASTLTFNQFESEFKCVFGDDIIQAYNIINPKKDGSDNKHNEPSFSDKKNAKFKR